MAGVARPSFPRPCEARVWCFGGGQQTVGSGTRSANPEESARTSRHPTCSCVARQEELLASLLHGNVGCIQCSYDTCSIDPFLSPFTKPNDPRSFGLSLGFGFGACRLLPASRLRSPSLMEGPPLQWTTKKY